MFKAQLMKGHNLHLHLNDMIDKILCIDDDSISLLLNKMIILKSGITDDIITLLGGEEALGFYEQLVKHKKFTDYPRIILLDLNMPVMNGWEFLDRYLERYHPHFPETRIAVLSSTVDPSDIETSKGYSEIVRFISKPLSKKILEEIVASIKE